jgi:hypothetical protein
MPPFTITPALFDSALFGVVKLLFLVGFGLYIVFAFIATRQIQLMKNTVETSLSPWITLLGWAHLFLAILVFIFVFIIL